MSTLTTPSSNDVNSKRERRKEARPGELLQAALELFVEKGYAATRAEEVATRAGVSKGTLFLYFSSKEDLFKAVIQSNLSRHFMAWNQEFEGFEGSSADMLAYGLTSWWTQIGSTLAGGITKLVMSEARNFPEIAGFYEREVVKPGQHLIERILQRGIGILAPVEARLAEDLHAMDDSSLSVNTTGSTANGLEHLERN